MAHGGQYAWPGGPQVGQHSVHSTFRPNGNILTTSVDGFSGETTTTTYYNASQCFRKASVTDGNNHTTTF